MSEKQLRIRQYFDLVEGLATERTRFETVLHPEFRHREFPNIMNPAGEERDLEGTIKGAAMGKKILARQTIKVQTQLEAGDLYMVEAIWEGTLKVDAGNLRAGQVVRAFICMVFEFKDGKVFRQRNYDCYENPRPA